MFHTRVRSNQAFAIHVYVIVVRCRRVVYVTHELRSCVLFNGATSASRKPQALRHCTNGLYDASIYGYFATGPALHSRSLCTRLDSESARHLLGLRFWMDQSSPVVDPVLLSSVDVTRLVLHCLELGMSEFVGSDAFKVPLRSYSMEMIGFGESSRSSCSTCATRSCYMTFSKFPRTP